MSFLVASPRLSAQAGVELFAGTSSPKHHTAHVVSREERDGKKVYEIFSRRGVQDGELFRVRIGSYVGNEVVKDWSYGLVAERDLNGDGKLDFVWYGGDDTGQRLLWFLSAAHGFRCVNLFKTAEAAWRRKFRQSAPDLGEVGGDVQATSFSWSEKNSQLTIVIKVHRDYLSDRAVRFRVTPADFVLGDE